MRAWDAQWNDPKSARRDSSVPEDQSKLHKTGREPATNASSTAEPANAKDGMEEEGQDKQDSSTNSQPQAATQPEVVHRYLAVRQIFNERVACHHCTMQLASSAFDL